MPTSNLAVWPQILWMVESAKPHRTVLDVGPGHGKAAVLLREYLNQPPGRIDAVEAWSPYVEAFDLDRLYHAVLEANALDLATDVLAGYDLVLMVDVIEHMDKGRALELLGRIPGWVVICTPVEFFHNGPDLPPTEEHVSHWTADDWHALDRLDEMHEVLGGWVVRLRPVDKPRQ